MKEFIQFVVLGLGLGAIYALLAQGLVLIYRGSGVVNFAHGTFAMTGAIVLTETRKHGVNLAVALVAATGVGLLLGLLTQNLVMRPLRSASPLARIIATLGILIMLQSWATRRYGSTIFTVPQYLPRHTWDIGGVTVQSERVLLLGIGVLVTVALIVAQQRWLLALATRAAAEDETAVAALGWSPDLLATVNWCIGGSLAGLAGALIVPLTGLIIAPLVLLVVPALAAALLGKFDSFAGTLLGAVGIGIIQSLITRYWNQTGAGDAVPFMVIILVLVVTGRSLPLRSHVNEKLPTIGSGRVRPGTIAVLAVLSVVLVMFVFNRTWIDAFTVLLSLSVLLLSIVVLTGYAGQISLAQFALAGWGAFVAGRLISAAGWPFWAAALAGISAAAPFGAAFALPALRTRGVNLAVVTLGMGVAINAVLFQNVDYTGGGQGTVVGRIDLFGYEIDALVHPHRYAVFVIVGFALALIAVGNLRRSASGRRLIAIRENERAATSLGISVVWTKLYAFTIASMLASLGGILISFRFTSVIYTAFDPFQSILALSYSVIGGVGYLAGTVQGATLAPGALGSVLAPVLSSIESWLPLISGAVVILILIANPDGIVPVSIEKNRHLRERVAARTAPLRARLPRRRPSESVDLLSTDAREAHRSAADRHALVVRDLTVRFGGVVAVDGADLHVAPGEVVGLIGPNGAGKTTLIDAVTGFVRPARGSVMLGDNELVRKAAHRRVRAGVARSWQSLELFEGVNVLENLLLASEAAEHTWHRSFAAPFRPGRAHLNAATTAAVTEFALTEHLDMKPGDLPYGRRRQVGIARAVALDPSVLLLDEPAAGLSTVETTELGSLVRRLADTWGMGVLLVEHDMDLVMSVCDRIVVMEFGRVIADGTPDQVRTNPAVIAAYLGAPPEDQRDAQEARL